MDIKLPLPRNWQDFENICHKLWREIWNDSNTQKNGRLGQTQAGVDIFDQPIYSEFYHGVQCKDKDCRLGSILTSDELLNESIKAKEFKPIIKNYTLATTSPRDVSLQEFCRKLNEKREFDFSIDVWSWDDIEAEIAYRPLILNHYYPQIVFEPSDINKIKLNRYSTRDNLNAFFSRPILLEKISKKFKSFLLPFFHELIDNSYRHGKATVFEIEIFDNQISISDDGIEFNPLTQLDATKVSSKSHVGSYVVKTFLEKFGTEINSTYLRVDNRNKINLSIDDSIFYLDDDDHFEMSVDLFQLFSREAATVKANEIPKNKKEIIIYIDQIGALSSLFQFIHEALIKIDKDQTITLSLPRGGYMINTLEWFNDSRLKIKFR